ncbi:MAG: bifunctional folylpolyglutamate synthase/dihydrofolate synthase [Acidobacteriota bacterium]
MTLRSKTRTLSYLYGLQKFGIKLGLRNSEQLLAGLDNPHRAFPSVHIAGTNGKGSTSSMIAAVLSAAGYRVGLYTSPHLIDFNERIRINGRNISDSALVRYAEMIRPAVDRCNATFFEATTAIAFRYFADRRVDIAVVETGLGGRLDATNVLTPLVSVITSIGKDHMDVLGDTIAKIAREKGGIIKPGVPCVAGRMPAQAKKVLERIARANSSRMIAVQDSAVDLLPDGTLTLEVPGRTITSVELSLKGTYQKDNAAAALCALNELAGNGFAISDDAIRRGFDNVGRLSGLRARMQIVERRPMLICDVAHNPDAARVLADSIRLIAHRRLHLIFGVMKDKDYRPMIRTLSELGGRFYCVQASIERSLSASDLFAVVTEEGGEAEQCSTIASALRAARAAAHPDDLILVTGSHYIVGEAMSVMKQRKRVRSRGAGKK